MNKQLDYISCTVISSRPDVVPDKLVKNVCSMCVTKNEADFICLGRNKKLYCQHFNLNDIYSAVSFGGVPDVEIDTE